MTSPGFIPDKFKAAESALAVRAEGGLTKAEAFLHKHSKTPIVPIAAAVLGTIFLGPVGLVLGGALGWTSAKAADAHYTNKLVKGSPTPEGSAPGLAAPTGYEHVTEEPSKKLQADAAAFLKKSPKVGATKKVTEAGQAFLYRIEKHPTDDQLGVTVYKKTAAA